VKKILITCLQWTIDQAAFLLKKLAKWCQKNPLYTKVVLLVVIIHVTALITLAKQKKDPSTTPKPTRLTVNTIQLKPQPKHRKETKKITLRKKKKNKKITKKIVQKSTKNQKLLKKALNNLNQLESIPLPTLTLTATPTQPNKLLIDAIHEPEKGYFNLLTTRLQTSLCLPEYGEVKLRLNLNRNGRVIGIDILHAANTINQQYLEKALPTVSFPPFNQYFSKETSHSFVITLKNEISR